MHDISNHGAQSEGSNSLVEEDYESKDNTNLSVNKYKMNPNRKPKWTVKTATGIERFQNEKGYGSWFNQLYCLMKTRDSCQPWQAIEPSSTPPNSSCEIPEDGSTSSSTISPEFGLEKDLFVPIKTEKKKEDTSKEVLEMMKKKKLKELDSRKQGGWRLC